MPSGKEVVLAVFDRLAMGDQLMMLRWKLKEDELTEEARAAIMTGEEAVEEFQNGLVQSRSQQVVHESFLYPRK